MRYPSERLRSLLFGATIEDRGLLRSSRSDSLQAAYRVRAPALRHKILLLAHRLEGGRFRSATLRDILRDHHDVEVGAYSYGCCLQPGAFPRGVSVGRYVSTAKDVGIYRRKRQLDRAALHPYFFNPDLGVVSGDAVESTPLRIEHDAWIGDRSVVLPGCAKIGVGAVVGAGAVVTRDVPDFAVVAGNPAKVVKFRFSNDIQTSILESRWWERTIEELATDPERFTIPVAALPRFVHDPDVAPRGELD